MKWMIVVIVLAVLLAAALLFVALRRKKQQAGRERASELRSDAAISAQTNRAHESRLREVQAEADRARAEADGLEERAKVERTAFDMTHAEQEDSLREADRLDPDVDHRAAEYRPDLNEPRSSRTSTGGAADPRSTDPTFSDDTRPEQR